MKFILGRKLNMTQIFKDNGDVVPVTVVEAGPCQITQVKNLATDGYLGVQVGFGHKNRLFKSLLGHLKSLPKFKYLREFRLKEEQLVTVGQTITVAAFAEGESVRLTGVSKGKGFQGVVKRHHFSGSLATHGHKDQLRMPGSIGSTGPQRVFKGVRMAGRMGNDTMTYNLEIVKIDTANNLLYVKGAVPGARNGLILIQNQGELKEIAPVEEVILEEQVVEAPVEEVRAEEVKEEISTRSGSASGGKEEGAGLDESRRAAPVQQAEAEVKTEEAK